MMLFETIEQALWFVAIISGVPLVISTLMSLMLALLQAATQVQEQSLGFVVKVGVVSITLFFSAPTVVRYLLKFFETTLLSIQFIGV